MTIYRGPGGTGSATSDVDTTEFQEFLVQSQAARDAAVAAKVAAELAETNAETAETNAETAETNAETAATSAASSAASATGSATAAASSASAASTSATHASASASSASTSATAAASSASSAATSASNAATSATNAASSATSASSSASTATTQATNAAASASSASTSATSAASSATAASTSATNAATSATSAGTSATNASNSASAASTSATAAAASATSASTSASTATTKASEASTSATNAAVSASSASTSASTATTQASNAASSASAAASSASSASASASTASTAKTAAEAARDAALSAYDNFDDRYLGPKSSDPTLDNDGNALLTGALYFNTLTNVMKVYTGSAWVAAYVSAEGVLLTTNNLSDVANTATARTNLNVPTRTGGDASGTWGIAITGNAATVTNGVYTSSSYADPIWITSLAGSKVSGDISGNATNVTGTVAINNGGTGSTTASAARIALGVAIGTNVQAWDADLDTWATKTAPSGTVVGTSDTQTLTNKTLTSPTLTTPNINSAQFATVTGTAPIYPCRAWVNFNGTGTVAIRASGNVTSITDNGTGSYTVNFTTAMPDANYSVAVACALTANYPVLGTGTPSTTSVAISIANQTASTQAAADSASVFVQIFR